MESAVASEDKEAEGEDFFKLVQRGALSVAVDSVCRWVGRAAG